MDLERSQTSMFAAAGQAERESGGARATEDTAENVTQRTLRVLAIADSGVSYVLFPNPRSFMLRCRMMPAFGGASLQGAFFQLALGE